jgi:hypothetical protein
MPKDTSTPAAATQSETKQARVIHMLRSMGGATLPALMKATGWQSHSVRGFFSGVVRKKLKLELVSDGDGDQRVYRIRSGSAGAAKYASSKTGGKK